MGDLDTTPVSRRKLAGQLPPENPRRFRVAGTTPAERGNTVGAPERSHEVTRVTVADPPANLLHCQVGLDQETPRLRHAPLGDPLLHRPSRFAPDDRGEMAPRQVDRPRHVLKRDRLAVALLDEAEDLCEQGLVLEPEISYDVRSQPRELHEKERQVRQRRLPVAVPPQAKLGV